MINERYLIKKKLGQGRSAVYLCSDSEFPDKDQAIKILSPTASTEEIQSFRNEFFILRRLNHPNIIKSNELGSIVKLGGEEQGVSIDSRFLTMEFFRGVELIKYGKLKEEKILLEIIKQLCSVLYYLHQSNYIYYDLKHENILINENNGKPEIKLIDLGFAQYIPDAGIKEARGTAEYIAPELLRNEDHDHRVDLYSLGMLLYRIIYNTFPFKSKNEIDIYKSHLEEQFDFSETNFSEKLILAVKKLLAKNPDERYANTLEILNDLDIGIDEELTKDWIPVSSFSSRKDILTIIDTYLADKHSSEIFIIKGSEGAGKTALLNEFYARNNNAIPMGENKSNLGNEFVRLILKRIIYSGFVYPELDEKDIERAEKLMTEFPSNLVDELKSLLGKITRSTNFILLLDGFNFYDDFTLEVLKNIFPILQVNGIKIILSENTDGTDKTGIINNLREINLTPFTETQLNEFIERSYYPVFPSRELKKTILQYADLLPGNIIAFIKDLILLKIIQFEPDGVRIKSDDKTDLLLKSSHEEIYKLRISTLTDLELNVANLISSLDTTIDRKSISLLMDMPLDQTTDCLTGLQNKNIIQQLTLNSAPVFTTEGLKKFVYSNIQNKKEFHSSLIKKVKEKLPGFNKIELSRQYELTDNYFDSFLLIRDEISEAENISAFSYQEKLLNHLLEIPLEDKYKDDIKFELCGVLHRLGNNKKALELIDKIESSVKNKNQKLDLIILKGKCQIGSGDYEEGKNTLMSVLEKLKNGREKQKLLVDIANAEFELNRYSETIELCNKIIQDNHASATEKGRCLNFLGLIEIYKDNNLDGALKYFEKAEGIYESAFMPLRVAQMEMNMGNIYNIKGQHNLAESNWNKSLELNRSIGNIDQEARLLVSFGILNYDKNEFQKAIDIYQRASTIFLSLGNKAGEGLAQTNLGLNYLMICKYQKAIDSFSSAKTIFESIHNYNEYFEALFLLCKTFYVIGDLITFPRLLNEFKDKLQTTQAVEKHKDNYEYLRLLSEKNFGNIEADLEKLDRIKDEYLKQGENNNYFSALILKIKIFNKLEKYEKVFEELKSEELQNLCNENPYFEAECLYYLGIISSADKDLGLGPSIELYLNAYDLIKDLNITELTWKILLVLTINYAERGNSNKAKTFLVYTKSVLDYLSENLIDPRLKMVYFDEPERQSAIEIINKLIGKI